MHGSSAGVTPFSLLPAAVFFFTIGLPTIASATSASYTVVNSESSVRIHVGKSGLFSFAGHKHEVRAPLSGTVTAEPENLQASRVDLTFDAAGLRVIEEGEPEGDAPKVEAAMRGPEVLDAARFPLIRFTSKQVSGREASAGLYELTVVGALSLHGMTVEITLPVKVSVHEGTLTATGKLTLRHDQFGMKPVTAVGGTVKVANEIEIDFKIVAATRIP